MKAFFFLLYNQPVTIQDALKQTNVPLVEKEILLSNILKKDRSFLNSHGEFELNPDQSQNFLERVERRQKNEPIAYILGYQEFWGRKFLVNKHVLIPRADTEILVQDVLDYARDKKLTVVDVGTGSGCIALTLALEAPNLKVIATDVSSEALEVAKKNARFLRVENVEFIHCSMLEGINTKLDVIVANLPYIPTRNMRKLPAEIQDWEPYVALHSKGSSKNKLYQILFEQSKDKLNQGGRIFYEIDGRVFTK